MTKNRNRSDWFDMARKQADAAKPDAEPPHIVDRVMDDNRMARELRDDAAERAADADHAVVEALNWQIEQQKRRDAMLFAEILEGVDGSYTEALNKYTLYLGTPDPRGHYQRGRYQACKEMADMIRRHAAAAGVELE